MPPLKLAKIGFGTYKLSIDQAYHCVSKAYDLGYRFFDTATFYENEKGVGRALQNKPRQEFQVSTKVHSAGMGYHQTLKTFDRSLNELQLDYVDLYFMHWPNPKKLISETLEAMEDLKDKGKIREYAVSNCTIHHLEDILGEGFKPFANQVEYHLYLDQRDLFDFCADHHILIVGYTPLARGAFKRDSSLLKVAEKYQKTPAQIALRWLIQKEIVPIPKSATPLRIEENFNLFDFSLSDEDMVYLNRLNRNERVVCPDCAEFDY